jgi:hypothetical protein
VQIAVQRLGDAQERVDARRSPPALEPGDRGLCRTAQLGEPALRHVHRDAPLADAVGYLCEEPAAVAGGDALVQALERVLQIVAGSGSDAGEDSGSAMSPTRTRPGTATAP